MYELSMFVKEHVHEGKTNFGGLIIFKQYNLGKCSSLSFSYCSETSVVIMHWKFAELTN